MNLSQEAIKYILLSLGIVIVCYSIFLLYKDAMNNRAEIASLKDKLNALTETVDNITFEKDEEFENTHNQLNSDGNNPSLNEIVAESRALNTLKEISESKSYIEEVKEDEDVLENVSDKTVTHAEEAMKFQPVKEQPPKKSSKKSSKKKKEL